MLEHAQPSGWHYRITSCPSCNNKTIDIAKVKVAAGGAFLPLSWQQVHPLGINRDPVPAEVPLSISQDYRESAQVLSLSPKASAALSRRCLQNVLHANGYRDRNLFREIELLINENDPRKAIPESLRTTIDGVRHFGNFSAHPINDTNSLQIIDVEPHEAEWCLDILDELFQHFYVRPAQAAARKAALDAKLAAAGKPPSR